MLKADLGHRRFRLNDDQRRRLALVGCALGRAWLRQAGALATPRPEAGAKICIATLLVCVTCAGLAARDSCTFTPSWTDQELVEHAWTCRAEPALRARLRDRGDRTAPLVLAFARSHGEARGWALGLFEELGTAGDQAYATLGPELVDWQLAGYSSGNRTTDVRRLKTLGAAAAPRLLTRLTNVCAGDRAGVLSSIADTGDPSAAPALEELAERRECDRWVRVLAGEVLLSIDKVRGVAVCERLLDDRAMSQQRGAIGKVLAHSGGQAGVAPAIRVLQEPSVPRSQRWDIAEALRATGIPEAVSAADRYQPSGRRGTGNPESPVGAMLTALLVGVCALLLVGIAPRPGYLTKSQRFWVVAASVIGAHVLGFVSYNVVGLVLTFYATPLLIIVAVIAGMLLPLIVIVRAIVRGWDLKGVSATIMAIAAVAGVLLGCYVDDQLYWYTARNESDVLIVHFFSALEQAVAWTLPLLASYLSRVPTLFDADPVGNR